MKSQILILICVVALVSGK